jgi:hypothetical protein
MEDVKYFQKKLYHSLNVPASRLEEQTGFNLGRASEISRDEVKFFKFVERLRMKFSELFLELLRVQLTLKGIIREDEWKEIEDRLAFKFAKDSHFTELKESEILKDRLQTARDAEDFVGKYYSREWVRKNILKQTEDEVEQIDKQIDTEQKMGLLQAPAGPGGPEGEVPQGEQPPPPTAGEEEETPQVTIGEIVPEPGEEED